MRGDTKSLLLNSSLMLAVRIALGVAFVVAALMIVDSARASAATEPTPATGSGLLSGILSPVENVVDKTVSQVPVVEAVPIVGPVIAPVGTAAVPIVTAVIAPPVIVLTVVEAVDAVTAPVLETVGQVVAPVVQLVTPAIDPVPAVVNPVVDSVVGGVAGGVGGLVEPVVPALPELPRAVPVIPVVPEVPGVVPPDIPSVTGEVPCTPSLPAMPASLASATSATQSGPETATRTPVAVAHRIPANGLDAAERIPVGFWAVDVPALSGAGSPGSSTHDAACSSKAGQTVGPCAPAVVSNVGSAPSCTGSGGSSGTAANENFSTSLNFAAERTAISSAGWPLPASMPSDPGSSPD
ncbi:hypothetical protein [Arthrobacter sp. TWP1-1]|uniref:hypothetical protein n=1 Tax=Arthrobacter sp. TWP1-1 TaxID=2804568 RepID=UPI003CFAE8DB